MSRTIALSQKQPPELLLQVATVRPVMILGAPGMGKTALVNQFAELVGLPCVSLLRSQLAPEGLDRRAAAPAERPEPVLPAHLDRP